MALPPLPMHRPCALCIQSIVFNLFPRLVASPAIMHNVVFHLQRSELADVGLVGRKEERVVSKRVWWLVRWRVARGGSRRSLACWQHGKGITMDWRLASA